MLFRLLKTHLVVKIKAKKQKTKQKNVYLWCSLCEAHCPTHQGVKVSTGWPPPRCAVEQEHTLYPFSPKPLPSPCWEDEIPGPAVAFQGVRKNRAGSLSWCEPFPWNSWESCLTMSYFAAVWASLLFQAAALEVKLQERSQLEPAPLPQGWVLTENGCWSFKRCTSPVWLEARGSLLSTGGGFLAAWERELTPASDTAVSGANGPESGAGCGGGCQWRHCWAVGKVLEGVSWVPLQGFQLCKLLPA